MVFGALFFVLITNIMVLCGMPENYFFVANGPEPPQYSIWVDGQIMSGRGTKDDPVGISCPDDKEPQVLKEQVAPNRWRIKISCADPPIS